MDSFQMENLWNYNSQFDNFQVFSALSNTVMYQPLTEFQQVKAQNPHTRNFMNVFGGGKHCQNSLRLLSTEVLVPQPSRLEEDLHYFCMYSQNENTNTKKYSLLPYNRRQGSLSKVSLALDEPSKVLVVNKTFLVGVERKCITLYRIHQEHLILKDFDSIGIGGELILAELQHLSYKGKDYLLVFGNQKQQGKSYFKCLVYLLSDQKLRFIKKASLFEREHYKAVIVFDHYPGKQFNEEQFCLVLGGFSDYEQQNYNFAALQIHLHLLIEEWIEYPLNLTREILFNKKHTITAGKGLKIGTDISRDQFWLVFCTEYQTITKMDLTFGQHDDEFALQDIRLETKTLKVRDELRGSFEPIYYSENTMQLVRVGQSLLESRLSVPYRVYWCNQSMERVCSRPLAQLLKLFCHSD